MGGFVCTKKLRTVVLLFAAVLSAFVLCAQQPLLKHFTVKEGLPSNEVYFITQDKKGRIWICTDAGVVRYNSSEFKIFNSAQGLPDNTIFEVKEDVKGRMWFRSFSGKHCSVCPHPAHDYSALCRKCPVARAAEQKR